MNINLVGKEAKQCKWKGNENLKFLIYTAQRLKSVVNEVRKRSKLKVVTRVFKMISDIECSLKIISDWEELMST